MSYKQLYLDLGNEFKDDEIADKTYTKKKKIVQYEDFEDESKLNDIIADCVDTSKFYQLVSEIDSADITPRQKKFLKMCATRHIKFNFHKIASHYVASDKNMQKLMESQGLVIIDFDDAIENGYTHLSESIDKMSEKDYISANEEGDLSDDETL